MDVVFIHFEGCDSIEPSTSTDLNSMWPKKIIARIEGGLGNQLFQYAAARSLADRLGCDLALDLRGLAENGDRPYELHRYRIRASLAVTSELHCLPEWRSSRRSRLHSRISQLFPEVFSFPVFWASSFAFDNRFEKIKNPVYLVGYWQSEKYFLWNRHRLLQDIQLVVPLASHTPILNIIGQTTSVALHIRRGDYVTNPAASQYHGLCDLVYYQCAVEDIKSKLNNINVFVFSDEPEWARSNINFDVPTQIMDANSSENGFVDLELMSRCQHHIIANSSFSWWGAWRSQSPDQRVYAPHRWFRDLATDISDVVPSRWQTLD